MNNEQATKQAYQAPVLTELGNVSELTLGATNAAVDNAVFS